MLRRKFSLLIAMCLIAAIGFAQTDTTHRKTPYKSNQNKSNQKANPTNKNQKKTPKRDSVRKKGNY